MTLLLHPCSNVLNFFKCPPGLILITLFKCLCLNLTNLLKYQGSNLMTTSAPVYKPYDLTHDEVPVLKPL